MDCHKCNEMISHYIDKTISQEDKNEFEKHIQSCVECSRNYQLTEEIVNTLNKLEDVKVPNDLSSNIMTQIKMKKGSRKMNFKRLLSYAAVLICGVFISTLALQWPMSSKDSMSEFSTVGDGAFGDDSAFGGGRTSNESGSPEMMEEQAAADSDMAIKGEVTYNTVFDKEKIIYHGNISLNVKDSEKASTDIKSYIESNGGFIESSYMNKSEIEENGNEIYPSQSYLVLRVPSAKFNETLEKLKEFGEETSTNINSTNISTQYRDIQSEKDSLEIQEERLLNYLKEAEKVEDMITIESELNRVRTNLNMINTQLNNYDQLISYSNITVNLREAKTLSTTIKSPFGQLLENISKGFISSINLLLQSISFLIVGIFRLIPFLIVIIPVGFMIKKVIDKRK